MGSHVVTARVIELLEAEPSTKGLFKYRNLCISGTHTHSAPAGFLTHTIFQVRGAARPASSRASDTAAVRMLATHAQAAGVHARIESIN